jgi:hypothetical protein
MGSGCAVSDAWEVLANIGGNCVYPRPCALKALPYIQEAHIGTSRALCCRNGCCVGVVATVALEK